MTEAAEYDAHDAGFVNGIDPASARRQFNISLALILMLGVATAAVGLTIRVRPMEPATTVRATVQAPQLVPIRHADIGSSRAGG
jgi:hypothetical protein